jgi:hypothetical protein
MAIIVVLLQDRSGIGGFSLGFIILGLAGGYVLFRRPRSLAQILFDPVMVTAYILLGLGYLIEFLHPHASYREILRIGQMIAGAIIVASLCRDRSALRLAMHSYLIAGLLLSVYMFLASFTSLSRATATDFFEANQVRRELFENNPYQGSVVYLTPVPPVYGAAVALALTLTAHTPYGRYLLLAATVFCSIAATLSLSRTAILMLIGSLVAVMFTSGIRRGRTILTVGLVGTALLMWVPAVVWSRFTFSTEMYHGAMEARARVYTAAVEHFPEYALTGVGSGNFWGAWGRLSQYGGNGAHNVFIQVTVYWGLAALLALMAVAWQAYRCLPRHCGADPLSLQLLGVSVAALVMSLGIHNLYAKDFSLVLGLLVGARRWIWPQGVVRLRSRQQRLPRFILAHMRRATANSS